MSPSRRKAFLTAGLAALLVLALAKFWPERARRAELPADTVARAVETNDPQLLKAAVAEHLDVNARDAEGRTPLLLAVEKGDAAMVERLVELGADANAADAGGRTSLMQAGSAGEVGLLRELLKHKASLEAVDSKGRSAVHYAVTSRQTEAVELLLESVPQLAPVTPDKPDLLALACETEDAAMIAVVLNHAPANLEWTKYTRRALDLALENHEDDLTRLLLSKHPSPPTLEGRNVPLLAQAIVDDEVDTCRALLEAGADPNAVLPIPPDKDFLKQLPGDLRGYVKADEGITPLMIAAGAGRTEIARVLLDAGAARNRTTKRYKMLALYFAVRTEKYNLVQMLLGSGPKPDDLRIEISLATQKASVIKDGQSIFQTQVSTGREGYPTPAGKYVITDKNRDHVSSIYKVAMPYFMRLNCRDFGMHEGVVPNRPASHGCIRLPSAAAKKLFTEIPVGTVVMIN